MRLHRSAWLLRAYGLLPHRLMGGAVRLAAEARRPRWAVQAAIRFWVRRGRIDLGDFEPGPYASLQDFFLRGLSPGARPTGAGLVSPADGVLVEAGRIEQGKPLWVKGQRVSLDRLVNAGGGSVPLEPLEGGQYAVIFLTPDGYHHVHAPCDAEAREVRWIAGRFFPQNEDALRHVARIYERNERAVLRLDGGVVLVLVGASLVGGIHLDGLPRRAWVGPAAVEPGLRWRKGERLGHFSLGSTVVMLLPRGHTGPCLVPEGSRVRVGERLFHDETGTVPGNRREHP